MNQYIRRMEKTTANAVYRALQKDKKDIQEYLRSFDTTKGFLDTLHDFLARMGRRVVDAFIPRVKTTITRGSSDIQKLYKDKIPNFSIDFSIATRPESVYVRALEDIQLSPRKGSITFTTIERIKEAVVKGTKEGLTYSQIADDIERLDPTVFSRNRAELIAINQVGKAYQFGEYTTMQAVKNEGNNVLKYWNTVHDNRVTPRHRQNESDGWCPMDHTFSGTGDLMAPASDHPRCRCAIIYNVGGEAESLASKHSREYRNYIDSISTHYSPDNVSDELNHALSQWDIRQEYHDMESANTRGLTRKEMISLYEYATVNYEPINHAVRSRSTASMYNGIIANMHTGMQKLDLYRGDVWRGTTSEHVQKQLTGMELGDIFSDSGFMSTSFTRSTAERFQKDGILMKVKSKSGRDMKPVSWGGEDEILFLPGTSFRLIDKKADYYILQEI